MNFGLFFLVLGTASFKVLFAVGAAVAAKQPPLEAFLALFIGQFLGMLVFTLAGTRFRNWNFKRRLRKSGGKLTYNIRKARRLMNFWKKFGLVGVSAIAPLIMPPFATLIAVSFGSEAKKIILYMTTSFLIWSLAFAFLGDFVHRLISSLFA